VVTSLATAHVQPPAFFPMSESSIISYIHKTTVILIINLLVQTAVKLKSNTAGSTYKVTWRRVRETVVTVESVEYYVFLVCVCVCVCVWCVCVCVV
jgi:hypothetical protein